MWAVYILGMNTCSEQLVKYLQTLTHAAKRISQTIDVRNVGKKDKELEPAKSIDSSEEDKLWSSEPTTELNLSSLITSGNLHFDSNLFILIQTYQKHSKDEYGFPIGQVNTTCVFPGECL